MILIEALREIAKARLEDATILATNHRPDGAFYLGGYAVEVALKARICQTLNWTGFPENSQEFKNLTSFRTHKLDVLLTLSGQEERAKTEHLWAWSTVAKWDPEARYQPIGRTPATDPFALIFAAEELLKVL